MEHRSPITPITPIPFATRAVRDTPPLARGAVVHVKSATTPSPTTLVRTRDRPAAAALALSAVGLAADIVVRPLLAPDTLPHPVVQWAAVAVVTTTAIGVLSGSRLARRVARGLGYIAGAGSFLALSRFASYGSGAEWWVVGVWALEAAACGFVLHRLGWAGDDT